MQELLLAVARGLVEDKEAVKVTVDEPREDGTIVYHLSVAEGDMGRVIGKQGRIAKAIRVVMRAAAVRVDEKAFDRIEAMIYSMTKEEREKPSIINPKRKRRIAAGSGTTVADVNKLLKQFEMMQKMMKQFKKSPKGFARRLGGMMGNPNAFRGLK